VIFSAAIALRLARGSAPDCHCFGQLHSAPVSWKTLARNGVLTLLAGAALTAGLAGRTPSAVTWIGNLRGTSVFVPIIVVTADHGNAVIPHAPRRNPTHANLGQIAPIPLFVKVPGQIHGRVVDRHVCTTEILPMTARRLGIRYPWKRFPCPANRVTVANSPSGESSLPFARVERLRDRYVERIDRSFGEHDDWGPVIRFGPNPDLVGRPVSSLPVSTAPEESVSIDDESRLRDVAPRAAMVLASLLRGTISDGDPGEALAVAINGRLAAVGRSFSSAGSEAYSLLIPPHYLRSGANRAEVYRVLGSGSSIRLQRLGP